MLVVRMMDRVQDSIYEKTYNQYLAGDTTNVRKLQEGNNRLSVIQAITEIHIP